MHPDPAINATPPATSSDKPGAAKSASKPNRKRSAGRLWWFRGMAVLCGILPFVLVEGGLRGFGFGRDLRLLVPVRNSPGWFQLNSRFDEAFYGATDLSGPDPRPFQVPKPPGVFRIVVVGGSTVFGFPYAPELAFPRQLEVLLQSATSPQTKFEVLNAGMTALNSSSEVTVVEESLLCQPDLFIVYTGHNEFYGPNGAAASNSLNPAWYRALAHWKRYRLAQLFRRLTKQAVPTSKSAHLIEQFATDVHVSESSQVYQTATRRLEQNLELMVTATKRRSIPLLLVGPACNERHQPPIEPTIPDKEQPAEPSWHKRFRQAERHRVSDEPVQALTLLRLLEKESESAIVQFRLAQLYDGLRQFETAATHYRRARDLDGGRFRAPSGFAEIIRRVSERHAGHAFYLDMQRAMERDDPVGITGSHHFLEHVHLTWEGNACVAKTLAEFAGSHRMVPVIEGSLFLLDEVDSKLRIQQEERLAARILSIIVYQTPPFSAGADADLSARHLVAEVMSGIAELPTARRILFDELSPQEMSVDCLSALIRHAKAASRSDLIGGWLEAQFRRRPWNGPARESFLFWLSKHGRLADIPAIDRESQSWPCISITE